MAPFLRDAMNNLHLVPVFAWFATVVVAQVEVPAPAAVPAAPSAAAAMATPAEGFGRGVGYREALAAALEDAVGKTKGVAIARSGAVQSRLRVVTGWHQDLPAGWFDGEVEREREWVQQQVAGFVPSYQVQKKVRAEDGQWEVTVLAQVAMLADAEAFVIDLVDDDLRAWELERCEEGAEVPFARVQGSYEAPSIRDNLRATGVVRIVAKAGGVEAGPDAAPREREKQGQRLVASHKVVVSWQPMRFRSFVEKPNKARPSNGPRPQFLTAGAVQVTVQITDLVRDIAIHDRTSTISIDLPPATPVERLDAFAVQLGDRAKAAVAEAVFFALQPPVVLRKWPGEGGKDWFVEVAMACRIAQGYAAFTIGNQGSLANPDWQLLGRAAFVGGNVGSSTFRLEGVDDPSRIEVGASEVRPAQK